MSKDFVYVLGGLYNGGQERQLLNLSIILATLGFTCKIVIWNRENYSEFVLSRFVENGIDCHFLTGATPTKILELRKIASKASIIHSFTFYVNFVVFTATLFQKNICIGGLRGDIDQYIMQMGKIKSALNAFFPKKIIANSQIQANSFRIKYPHFSSRVVVVRNGFFGEFDSQVILEIPKIVEIISIGRIVDYKRFDLVLEVLAKLAYPWNLKIIGQGNNLLAIETLAKELNIVDYIQFVGEVENVTHFIRQSHIMMHMSDFEGTCNVIMESIANARPVIATKVGDNEFLIDHGKSGFIVEKGSIEQAKVAIDRLIQEEGLLSRMSENALSYAKENFSMESYASNTIKAYKSFGYNN